MSEGRRWMMVVLMAVSVGIVQAKAEEAVAKKIAGATEKKSVEHPLVLVARARAKGWIAIKKGKFLINGNKSKYDVYAGDMYRNLATINEVLNKAVADENKVAPETRDNDFIRECASKIADCSSKWQRYYELQRPAMDNRRTVAVAAWHQTRSTMDQLVVTEQTARHGGSDVLAFVGVYESVAARIKELTGDMEEGIAERKALVEEWEEFLKQCKALDGEHFGR